MQLSSAIIPYAAVAALLATALFWYLERERRLIARSFRTSSEVLALGLPAVPTDTLATAERARVLAEFRAIGEEYRRRHDAIDAARADFFLTSGIRLFDPAGGNRYIRNPARLLTCDVILGDSLASAELTPGSAIYWLRLSGADLESIVKADASFAADIADGHTRMVMTKDFMYEIGLEGLRISDRRSDGLGEVELTRGTPMLLKLDEDSENALEEALGADAPKRGTSRKVRLFGGFEYDEERDSLLIIPYRQQPGMITPEKGRLHPLSSLLGIVVGEAKDKAFLWKPTAQHPMAEGPALEPRPAEVFAPAAPVPSVAVH